MKKFLFLLLCSLLFYSTGWAYDYTADAVAAFLFQEGSGTTVDDASPNSNTGTFASSGHPAWSSTVPPGYSNYSASFDGANDTISTSNPTTVVDNFSFGCWMSWSGVTNNGQGNQIAFYNGNAGSSGWGFNIYEFDGHLYILFGGVVDKDTGIVVPVGVFKHYYFVRNNGVEILYVNGVAGSDLGMSAPNTPTAGCVIGDATSTPSTQGFWGLSTQFAIFSAVLTSTEIDDIMNNGLKPAAATYSGQVIIISD
jgi:hypothetical protein